MDNGTYTNLGWINSDNVGGSDTNFNLQSINDVNQASIEKLNSDGQIWRYNNGQIEPLNKGSNNQLLESGTSGINWTSDIDVNNATINKTITSNIEVPGSDRFVVNNTGANDLLFELNSGKSSQMELRADNNNLDEYDLSGLFLTFDARLNHGGLFAEDDQTENSLNLAGGDTVSMGDLNIGNNVNFTLTNNRWDVTIPSSYPAISVDNSNDVTIKNTLTLKNDLYLKNNQYDYSSDPGNNQTNALSYYRFISYTTSGTANTSQSIDFFLIQIQRIGKAQILTVKQEQLFIPSSNISYITLDTFLPSWAHPSSYEIQDYGVVVNKGGGIPVNCRIIIRTTGEIALYADTDFQSGTTYQFTGIGVSYI